MKIFILTGAGISAESGLGTFRDKDGLWSRFDLNEVATVMGFRRDPAKVHEFYNLRRQTALAAEPNPAHFSLARLARDGASRDINVFLCTQNVDDLHERADSEGVVHMHGSLFEARCLKCRASMPWRDNMDTTTVCPSCGASGRLRPGVVWFGEKPLHLAAIEVALQDCNLFVAIGTSGTVYPAARFVADARRRGARTVELNLEIDQGSGYFDDSRPGPASQIVPAWVREVVDSQSGRKAGL